jgi:hypothetical protein
MIVGLRDRLKPKPQTKAAPRRAAAPAQSELDRQLVAELKGFGSDLSHPRDTRFFLYFGDFGDAEDAAHAVRDEGFETWIEPRAGADAQAEPWRLVASRELVVDDASVAATRALLGRIAVAHWGRLAGWEAAVDL